MALVIEKKRCRQLSVLLVALLVLIVLPDCNGFVPAGAPLAAVQATPGGHALTERSSTASVLVSQTDSSIDSDEKDIQSFSSSLASYHLIWSPQVRKRVLLTTLSLWILQRNKQNLMRVLALPSIAIPGVSSSFLYNAALPTLSSACCWIQVLLNTVTALGCAGFNTYLGPVRPLFLGLLTHLTLVTRSHTPLSTMVLRWTIALLPEMLHFWNTWSTTRQNNKAQTNLDNADEIVTVLLDCPTMGCVACINNVNSSLQKALRSTPSIGQIQKVDSWLLSSEGGEKKKGGQARLQFSTKDNETVDPQILVHALEQAGFPCAVAEVVQTKQQLS